MLSKAETKTNQQDHINKYILNPFIPEFLKWTLPFLNLDMSTDANRGFSLKPKTEWQSVIATDNIFLISRQKHMLWYPLEAPHQSASNK